MSSQLPLMEHFNRTSTSINSQRLNWFMGESQALVASIPRLWHREVSTTCGMPWSGLFFFSISLAMFKVWNHLIMWYVILKHRKKKKNARKEGKKTIQCVTANSMKSPVMLGRSTSDSSWSEVIESCYIGLFAQHQGMYSDTDMYSETDMYAKTPWFARTATLRTPCCRTW